MLVLAGPGSGKTFVITGRVRFLIHELHVSPESILVITFTKTAASEMKERYLKLNEEEFTPVTFSTFHSFFYQILKLSFHYNSRNIMTLREKRNYMREILALAQDKGVFYSDVELMLLEEIGFYKNIGEKQNTFKSEVVEQDFFETIYSEYEKKKQLEHKIDFEDMVICTSQLLRDRSDILKFWQERFRYILIDEFQDINEMQYETIKMLAEPGKNLFCVGDDDQAIYGFRGASPSVMRRFTNDYPDCRQILLSVNYRCTHEILETACHLIAHNKERFPKELNAVRRNRDSVKIRGFDCMEEEQQYILLLLNEPGTNPDEVALIFRTNIAMAGYAEFFTRKKIPYVCKEKVRSIYDEPVAKDILAYLAFAGGERTRANFFRIMNRPVRYISRTAVTEPVNLENLISFYDRQPHIADRIRRMIYDFEIMRKMSPYAAINYVRKGMGYDEYLLMNYGTKKTDEILKIPEELMRQATAFSDYGEWKRHIRMYEECLNTESNEKKHGVILTTMHGAKGLEWKTVMIPDLNERIIPHKRAVLPHQMEEERRLFYVALTRAKENLYILYLKRNSKTMTELSRFLRELNLPLQ